MARACGLLSSLQITPLKNMPNEDATFGFWVSGQPADSLTHPRVPQQLATLDALSRPLSPLSPPAGMNLEHVAHPKIRTAAGECCLYALSEQDALVSAAAADSARPMLSCTVLAGCPLGASTDPMPAHLPQGRWRNHQLRMWEDMCAGWLVLHKASVRRFAPGTAQQD